MGQRLKDILGIKGPSPVRRRLLGLSGALLLVGIAFGDREKSQSSPLIIVTVKNDSSSVVTSDESSDKHSPPSRLSREDQTNSTQPQDTIPSPNAEDPMRPEAQNSWVREFTKLQHVLIKTPEQFSRYQELLGSPEVQKAMKEALLDTKSSEQEKNTAVDYIVELVTHEPMRAQALWSAVLEQPTSPEESLWEWQVELTYRLLHHPASPVSEEMLARHWSYSGKKEALARMHLPFDEL